MSQNCYTPSRCGNLDDDEANQFLEEVHSILMKNVSSSKDDFTEKVVNFKEPNELAKLIDLSLREKAVSREDLLKIIENTTKYSVKVGNPRFINQLYAGVDHFGLAGQWIVETLNPSLYTFEVSPCFVLIENKVISEMCRIVGFSPECSDGLFAPGGSVSTIYGTSIARYWKCPEVRENGLHAQPRLVAFASEFSHYCIEKACVLLGIGKKNLVRVKCDSKCRMIPEDLEAKIMETKKNGGVPFLVAATEGTTVYGAFDPLPPLIDICKRHACWLHVDAAWGGGLLMSAKYRQTLRGIEAADSVVWNPHKLLGAPQQCSAFLTRHKNLLKSAHSACANYLFQTDKFYDTSLDPGDKTLQCGRKVDSYKFWLMWKAKGTEGLAAHVDWLMDLADCFTHLVENRPGFYLVKPPSCTNICFWYVPPSQRCEATETRLRRAFNEPPREYTPDELLNSTDDSLFWQQLDRIAPKIKERMVRSGSMMITYTRAGARANFFRFVLQSSRVTERHLQFFVDEIENLGCDL